MKKKTDYLIVYEVKNRELENICLLKCELEMRGYTVEIHNTWNTDKEDYKMYDTDVIIGPWLYDDTRAYYLLTLAPKATKLVNLQWEQVYTNSDEIDNENLYRIKGVAKDAVHICWGIKNYNRLAEKCCVDTKKLNVLGNITLDFLRDEFRSYYFSRDELFDKYNISKNKKVALFISSFAYVNISNQIIKNVSKELNKDMNYFVELSSESQSRIIEWFRKLLYKSDEYIIIYRPHPAESDNKDLLLLQQQNKNKFYVISDLSIKQWILSCDIIYNWYSTSLAEIYAAKKTCYILRPLEIPWSYELPICQNAKFIKDFNTFEETLISKDSDFPINNELLELYYNVSGETPVYKKLSDFLEKVIKKQEYSFDRNKLPLKFKFKLILRNTLIYTFYNTIRGLLLLCSKKKNDDYMNQIRIKNYSSREEINKIVKKINHIIRKEDEI